MVLFSNKMKIMAQASFDLQTSTGFADFAHFPDDNLTANVVSSTLAKLIY